MTIMAVVIGLLVAFVAVFSMCYYYRFYHSKVKHMNKFVGPPTNLLVGNAFDFKDINECLYTADRFVKQYGKIVKLRMGHLYALLITDLKFIEFILTSNKMLHKSMVYNYLVRWLGTGLLTSAGSKWRKQRRLISPTFHSHVLEGFLPIFDQQSTKLIEKLETHVGKDNVDIFSYISPCTLDTICETIMGIQIQAQTNENNEYVSCVKTMCKIFSIRSSSLFAFDPVYKLSKLYRKELQAVQVLHETSMKVIQKRNKTISSIDENKNNEAKKKTALLDLLLQYWAKQQQMSLEDIREEVDTFLFAGHDTSATATAFALYSLAIHPDVQSKVFEEQREIFGVDMNRSLEAQDLAEMKYLENVIKETLRLYPPVAFFGRTLTEDVIYDGKVLPKDLNLIIFPYAVHRDPDNYRNPDVFDPTRFDDTENRKPYTYLPFSMGPRNCIGQKFGMMEIKVIISKIIRHFELLPPNPAYELKLATYVVLQAVNGIKIGLKKRT